MKKVFIISLVLLSFALCSCSDHDDHGDGGNSDNVSLVNPTRVFPNGLPASVGGKNITTDAKGRVVAIGTEVTFEYADAAGVSKASRKTKGVSEKYDVVMRSYSQGVLDVVAKINIGANGFASDMIYTEYYDGEPDEEATIQLSYDAAGHLTKTVAVWKDLTEDYTSPTLTNTLTWQNGDLAAVRVELPNDDDAVEASSARFGYENADGTKIDNLGGVIIPDFELVYVDNKALYYAGLLGIGTAHLPMTQAGNGEFLMYVRTYLWTTNLKGYPTELYHKEMGRILETFTW